jgi:hypothetical protein
MTKLVIALCGVTLALGLRFGTFTASGADSYGYVSQADLWLDGTLIIDQPLHDEVTWRWANWTLSPLGYRPGNTGGTMVPIYAPGLPLLMAAFKLIGGDDAVYVVVPLLGALTVWLTYRLGLVLAGPPVAALAAFALLVSPIFLFQLVWPMSDVPATAWWLAAIVTALGGSTRYAVLSGLAVAAAILTRPNLFPLAGLVLGLTLAHHGPGRVGVRRAITFAMPAMAGPIAVAIINNHLYGSPLASGYGTVETIYAGRHFAANIVQYPWWLVQTQTPFILLAFAAPFVLRRRGYPEASRLSLFALIFFGGVLLMYLWYTPYPDWTFLRFLLPGLPVLLVAAAASFGVLAPSSRRTRRVAFGVVAIGLAVSGVWQGRDAFRVQGFEARHRAAARFAAALPENAVFLCNQHSGSLRYYANRLTLRFEWLAPDVYVTAMDQLQQAGRPVFVVLDDWEREVFKARYAAAADLSWLDNPPVLLAANRVYFYQVPAIRR